MSKTKKQGLSRYVERVMREKHLSRRDVRLRSGGDITDSYVSGIISGSAQNLSIGKLKALARGLRVQELELVRVAFGLSEEPAPHEIADQSHNLVLLDISKKTVVSSDVAEIVHEVVKLSAADRAMLLQCVKRLGKLDLRSPRARRSL